MGWKLDWDVYKEFLKKKGGNIALLYANVNDPLEGAN